MSEQKFFPTLLSDKSRLQEIYDLRVFAWENSNNKLFVNSEYFPAGWKDNLDEESIHWIIEHAGKIIASCRLCIVDDIKKLDEDFSQFNLPQTKPFAFYSRLVVHPEFRNKGLSSLMDYIRLEYLLKNKIDFCIAYTSEKRISSLEKLNFKKLGTIAHKYHENSKIDISTAFILYLKDINLNSKIVYRELLKRDFNAVKSFIAIESKKIENDFFFPPNEEVIKKSLNFSTGISHGAFYNNELIGIRLTYYPELNTENHGYDLNYETEQLKNVAQFHGTIVSRDKRFIGVGKELVKINCEAISKIGKSIILATVHPDNEYSRKMLESNGFSPKSEHLKYNNVPRIIFEKVLTN